MAWRFRRSKRLPLGFRLNFSKNGIGYSWGFRGFRIGKDARGRVVRSISIPGTGLYRRDYITPDSSQSPPQNSPSSTSSLGCLTILAILAGFVIIAVGTGSLLVPLVVAGTGILFLAVASSMRRKDQPIPAVPQPATLTFQPLGIQAANLRISLKDSVKAEMSAQRLASQYETWFDGDITRVLFHFATLNGSANPSAGTICLGILGILHPNQWRGLSGDDVATIINNLTSAPSSDYRILKKPLLMSFAHQTDTRNGTQHAKELSTFYYEIARQVAISDGPLSARENEELDRFRVLPQNLWVDEVAEASLEAAWPRQDA